MSAYDKIARLYDPWSRSVVEDVSFYVDEACTRAGRCSSSASAPVGSPCRSRRRGSRSSASTSPPGCSRCRRAAALAGVELDLRQGDMREPPVDGRVPADPDPVPLAAAHGDRRRPARRAPRRSPSCSRRADGSSSTSSHRRRRHRRDPRPLARARAGDLGARRLERGDAHADSCASVAPTTKRRCRSPGCRSPSGSELLARRASSSTRSTAGSTARRGAAARTRSGSAGATRRARSRPRRRRSATRRRRSGSSPRHRARPQRAGRHARRRAGT